MLTDGSVVLADKHSNAGLFPALKGGSGNFGIVTRFELDACPAKPILGGDIVCPRAVMDQLIGAFDTKEVSDSSTTAFQPYEPSIKDSVIVSSLLNLDGVEWDEPHKDFSASSPRSPRRCALPTSWT